MSASWEKDLTWQTPPDLNTGWNRHIPPPVSFATETSGHLLRGVRRTRLQKERVGIPEIPFGQMRSRWSYAKGSKTRRLRAN